MTIDLCWQPFLDSVSEYPASWTAIGFLIFWTLRFMIGHKLYLVSTCTSRHRLRNRWYHRLDRISPFNLHDWQIYDEEWRKNRNYGIIPQSRAPLVCNRCRTVWRSFVAMSDQPVMDIYHPNGDDPLGFMQFDNSHIRTSDEMKRYKVEVSLVCGKCGIGGKQPAVDFNTQSNQLQITLGDDVFDHVCV